MREESGLDAPGRARGRRLGERRRKQQNLGCRATPRRAGPCLSLREGQGRGLLGLRKGQSVGLLARPGLEVFECQTEHARRWRLRKQRAVPQPHGPRLPACTQFRGGDRDLSERPYRNSTTLRALTCDPGRAAQSSAAVPARCSVVVGMKICQFAALVRASGLTCARSCSVPHGAYASISCMRACSFGGMLSFRMCQAERARKPRDRDLQQDNHSAACCSGT